MWQDERATIQREMLLNLVIVTMYEYYMVCASLFIHIQINHNLSSKSSKLWPKPLWVAFHFKMIHILLLINVHIYTFWYEPCVMWFEYISSIFFSLISSLLFLLLLPFIFTVHLVDVRLKISIDKSIYNIEKYAFNFVYRLFT